VQREYGRSLAYKQRSASKDANIITKESGNNAGFRVKCAPGNNGTHGDKKLIAGSRKASSKNNTPRI
jgi:hypothetical protein